MTQLTALQLNKKGSVEGISPDARAPSALDLILALDRVEVLGQQMFERDCLSFTFDLWRRFHEGEDIPENERISSYDILSDIDDIRALPIRHPEVKEVDIELLAAVERIETYIREHSPTLQ